MLVVGVVQRRNGTSSRPSEHPPVREGNFKMFSRCDNKLQRQKKTLHGIYMGSPMVVTLGQPTVILYSYVDRHAGTR